MGIQSMIKDGSSIEDIFASDDLVKKMNEKYNLNFSKAELTEKI